VRELATAAVADLRAAGVDAGCARLLTRAGRVRDSAGLSVAQRRANLAGTFAVRPGALPAGALLVVVDDVVTSGATLTEAAAVVRATRRDDDAPVLAAVVAATPRPGTLATPPGRFPAGSARAPDGAPRSTVRST
jgi:predicted amidophosphoribosyltransferase